MSNLIVGIQSPGSRRAVLLVLGLVVAIATFQVSLGSARAANTGTIAVCLTGSTGDNLVLGGDQAWIQVGGGSIVYVGPVGSSGCRETVVTNGTSAKVWVARLGTNSHQVVVDVPDGGTTQVDFYTTKVTLQYSAGLAYGGPNGDMAHFVKPSMELLPYKNLAGQPVVFRLDGTGGAYARLELPWPQASTTGATFTRSLVAVRLVDSANQPLAGGTAAVYSGGWTGTIATTNASGIAAFAIPDELPGPALAGNVSVKLRYNGTGQQLNQLHPANSVFNFKTIDVAVKLLDSYGSPLAGGMVSYYAGAWYSGVGTTAANGEVHLEMLGGDTYSFRMTYNNSAQQMDYIDVKITNPVVFQTGSLKVTYSPGASWFYSSNYVPFGPGPQELLPGNIIVSLSGCSLNVPLSSGDHLVKSGILARLRNSGGALLSGGTATAYAGSWQSIGTTNSACALLNGNLGNVPVKMVYNGSTQQISQHQPTSSVYEFKTTAVTVELRNSQGDLTDTGGASYYAGAWKTIGDTVGGKASAQILPGSYAFAMTYNGTREQKNAVTIPSGTATVTFTTIGVDVTLNDSNGDPLVGGASYYAGGWKSIGDTTGGVAEVEMLTGSYAFAVTYNGTREQKNAVNIAATNPVAFQTIGVDVTLNDSNGDPLVGGASYYAGGWKSIGDTTGGVAEVEMLTGSYAFAVTYNGTREQKNAVNIAATNPVAFQTIGVDVTLNDSNGDPLVGGASYYAGGWKSIGDTTGGVAEVEMLTAGSYAFAVTYNGTREQKNAVNIATTNPVAFNTGEVVSTSGTATAYYAGGWKSFTSGGQLLAGTYTFKWSSQPNAPVTVTPGGVTTIN